MSTANILRVARTLQRAAFTHSNGFPHSEYDNDEFMPAPLYLKQAANLFQHRHLTSELRRRLESYDDDVKTRSGT